MNCIHCGETAPFDRIVVDLATNEEVGSLCRDCEESVGELEATTKPGLPTCSLCRRRGEFAVPQWDIVAWDDAGAHLLWLEHDMGPKTPVLCDRHYESLTQTVAMGRTRQDKERATTWEVLNRL